MKGFRKVKLMLSGMAAVALVLSLFVPCQASTDAYWIKPQANTHNNGYNYVSQTFVATADSVTKISLFLGSVSGSSNYQMEIDSAGTAKGGVLSLSYGGAKAYADNEGTYGTPVSVKRGYTYTLKFSRSTAGEKVDFYYVADTTYPWGTITYPSGINGDLCARVVGVNRTDSLYWGIHASPQCDDPGWDPALKFAYIRMADAAGIRFFRLMVRWDETQDSSMTYHFTHLDPVIDSAKAHNQKVLITIVYPPKWASSCPDNDTAHYYQYPPKKMLHTDTTNYFKVYLDKIVNRYKGKVFAYEIFNEVNLVEGCNYPRTDTGGYDVTVYPHTHSGRAKLYATACSLAYHTIKAIDTARVVSSPVDFPAWDSLSSGDGIQGCVWLDYFYGYSGKNYSDVISYHFYPPPVTAYGHRFSPAKFQTDYDTLRGVMSGHGDSQKPLWADEGGWGSPTIVDAESLNSVSGFKQAQIVAQVIATGIGEEVNPRGPLSNLTWFNLNNSTESPSDKHWYNWAGLVTDSARAKASWYAYKQANTKLKGLYFNRQVQLGNPSDSVYCFEFQFPGLDTTSKTCLIWKSRSNTSPVKESLSLRSTNYDSIGIDYNGSPPFANHPVSGSSGKLILWADSTPQYIIESGNHTRPDVIVDSVWIYPTSPRAGDSVRFYARLKNIGNDSVKFNIVNKVTFQVDGITFATYQASRGLAPKTDSLKDTLTVGNSNPGAPPPKDWQTTWGDHLIRAWADSADRFVELREDNNIGYLWKHMIPKVSALINNNHEFTNHFNNDTLNLTFNGGTSNPDSMRVKNEGTWGSWIKPVVTTYSVNFNVNNGDGPRWDSVQVRQASDVAIGGDSIIVDATSPTAQITSPAHGATVSGTITISGKAYDSGYNHFWVDTLRYFRDSTQHDTIHVSWQPIGGKNQTGLLGNWNTTLVTNGWTKETLAVWDSAGNTSRDTIGLYVFNKYQGGAGFASGFGTYPSLTMNVATDPSGNVYVAETQGSRLRKFSPHQDSLLTFSVKRGSDSTGLAWAVSMILKDSTSIWIADGYAHAIKKFDTQGNLLLRFGSFGQDTGKFRQPCGIALDSKGRLWVVDRLNYRAQVFDSTGKYLFKFGSQGTDSGKFNSPTGIAITKQDTLSGITQDLVWVSDTRNNRVQVFDSLGNWVKTISQVDSLGLDTPLGICSDRYGDIFIADARHNRIVELNPFGQRILDFGGQGDSLCQFQTPVGLATSSGAHYLYVADMGNKRVQRFWVIQGDTLGGGGPQSNGVVRLPPKVYSLGQSYPNPTTGEAMIEYGLPRESEVRLAIYNVAGQVVREYNQGKQKAWITPFSGTGEATTATKSGAECTSIG